MKIESTQSDNLYTNMSSNNAYKDDGTASAQKSDSTSGVVYAGDLNLNDDTVDSKKQKAQKQALKAIMDQFKNEMKTDDNITSLKDEQAKLNSDMDDAAGEIKNLEKNKQDLKASYGVTDDSSEQKDLNLIEKSIFHPEEMTEKDYKQLQNVGPLTDYQKEALKTDAMETVWQGRINSAADGIHSINQSIFGIKLEKLKTHPMVDAQKEAIGILNAANDEIVNSLIKNVKDKVDDTIEKNKEDAEKKQEEKDKKDKEADKADKADNTNKTGNTDKSDSSSKTTDSTKSTLDPSDQQKLMDEIKRAADKQKMLEDDIKGIVVDEQV